MNLLSYPFRLAPNGQVVTVEQSSDIARAEQIGVLVLTRPGERALVPAFGVPDPAFGGLQPSDIAAAVQMFGPDVTITEVRTQYPSASVQHIDVGFE